MVAIERAVRVGGAVRRPVLAHDPNLWPFDVMMHSQLFTPLGTLKQTLEIFDHLVSHPDPAAPAGSETNASCSLTRNNDTHGSGRWMLSCIAFIGGAISSRRRIRKYGQFSPSGQHEQASRVRSLYSSCQETSFP